MDFSFLKGMSFGQVVNMLICILPVCYGTWKAMQKKVEQLKDEVQQLKQEVILEKTQSRMEVQTLTDNIKEVKAEQSNMITKVDSMLAEMRADIKLLLQRK